MRILHCFNWKIADIIDKLELIREQGFEMVLISPLQPHKEINYQYEGKEWYKLYQPYAMVIGNELGTKEDLKKMCNKAHEYKLKVMSDVVCNHVANAGGGDLQLTPSNKVDPKLLNNKYFWKQKKYISNWENEYERINYCMSLPSLCQDNYELEDNFTIPFLNEYIDCGIDGFRIDAGKCIHDNFYERVMSKIKRTDLWNMTEVLNADWDLLNHYGKYMHVLTNSTGLDHSKSVVFAESHDSFLNTDSSGWTRNTPEWLIIKDYIEICKQYKNTVFYIRPFSDAWMTKEIREANKF